MWQVMLQKLGFDLADPMANFEPYRTGSTFWGNLKTATFQEERRYHFSSMKL
jgi:hypothetical protein